MRVSLFLGAGASVPFGMPTTKQFKQMLPSIPEFNDHVIMKELLNVPEYQDIEHVLRAIEEIEDIGKYGKSFLRFLNTSDKPHLKLDFDMMLKDLNSCREIINKYVYKFYSFDINRLKNVQTNYDSLLKSVFADKVHIFTTNYDQIIEEYVRYAENLIPNDGFKHDESTNKNIFNSKNFEINKNDAKVVNIYKLHGSLNWKKFNGNIIRQDKEEQNKDEVENILIYPTLDPKNGLNKEPFSSINNKFETHSKSTDVFVVIGYAFRDSHVNEIFRRFLKSGKKLIIVSPTVESDLRQVNFISNENSISVSTSPENISKGISLKQKRREINELHEVEMAKRKEVEQIEKSGKNNDPEFVQIKNEYRSIHEKLLQNERSFDEEIKQFSKSLGLNNSKNTYKIQMTFESIVSTYVLESILLNSVVDKK